MVTKKNCIGCGEQKILYLTETPDDLELCGECLQIIWKDNSLKDDVMED